MHWWDRLRLLSLSWICAPANDGVFGVSLPPQASGDIVQYYVESTVANNKAWNMNFLPANASFRPRSTYIDHVRGGPTLRINELMAVNATTIKDEANEFADWVEIYNSTNAAINVSGMYLSDDPTNPTKWKFPANQSIPARGTILVWCDNDSKQGPLHAGFKLDGDGEWLGLFDTNGITLIDDVDFGVQQVDVSMQEANANIHFIVSQYGYNSTIAQRPGVGAGGGSGIFECSDGWVGFSPIQPNQFQALADWMGNEVLKDPVWQDLRVRMESGEFVSSEVSAFIAGFTVAEFVDEAQKRRIPAAPVSTVAGLASNVHLNAREYFQEVESDSAGRYTLPGPPGRFSETPWRIARPAPRLGEHTDEVLAEAKASIPAARARSARAGASSAPFDGIRITDLTRVWVGPYGTRQLADFGAEVIKIESSLFDATSRIAGILPMHPELNRNKLSITVDLHHKDGQDLVKQLVATSDVVAENYAPGALKRWGLDYDSLRQVKEGIVYISMPGWGSTGPFSHHVLFGLQAQTASGVTHLWGHPDAPPSLRCGIYYADFFVGAQCGFMLETALYHRKLTGQGQLIEVSQVEAQANALGIPLLDHFVNGVDTQPEGNARSYAGPHGVYPCKGIDAWCTIACSTEEEWGSLVGALTPPMGQAPEWTGDPRFATLPARVENREALDTALSEWTSNLTPKQVMTMLQRHGVPASAVQTTEDVYFDGHLRGRGYVVDIQHPETQWGQLGHATFGAQLSETPGQIRLGAPALGQDNDYVLGDLLEMDESEVARLREDGVLA